MYPKISDLINDLFGTSINLPIQSYGLFLALAFLTGAFFLYKELDRKEKEGLLIPKKKKITKGAPATIVELVSYFLFSLIAGWKISGFITDYSTFVSDPQEYIFSGMGNWIGGFIIAIAYTGYFYYTKNKNRIDPPKVEEILVHSKELAWPILFIAVITGILGSKVFHWFENWDEFTSDPIGSIASFSGMTFYGGLIVASFSVVYFGIRNGIKWKYLADAISPPLILAYGIGRIGCQVSGDGDWGIVNAAPKPGWLGFLPDWVWSYTYPHNIINEGVLIPGCQGTNCYELAQAVFPTPVYETTMAVLIFLILWSIRKRIKIPGVLFSIYLMFNGLERFLIEKIRVNNVFDFLGMKVTQAEVISSLIFLGGLMLFFYFRKSYTKTKV